jgi:hypothetical protein
LKAFCAVGKSFRKMATKRFIGGFIKELNNYN